MGLVGPPGQSGNPGLPGPPGNYILLYDQNNPSLKTE